MKPIFRLKLNPRLFSLLVLVILLPLALAPAIAKPPNCTPDDPRPSCQGGGGDDSDYSQTNSANWVIWGDGTDYPGLPFETGDPRYCGGDGTQETNPNPQGGVAYVCHQDADFFYDDNWVVVDLSALQGTGALQMSGQDWPLCYRLLDPVYPGYPVEMGNSDPRPIRDPDEGTRLWMYFLSMDPTWNDGPCTVENDANSCYVKIYISAYFNEDCNEKGKCGRLVTMESWGHVKPNPEELVEGKVEINPFSQDQLIEIEEITVNFRGIRRDKVVATCYYDNWDEVTDKPILPIYFSTDTPPLGD